MCRKLIAILILIFCGGFAARAEATTERAAAKPTEAESAEVTSKKWKRWQTMTPEKREALRARYRS
ncbi:hypothetical protein KAR10_00135, partial [bacterium]|nr:hypothetical protein [bacterium]